MKGAPSYCPIHERTAELWEPHRHLYTSQTQIPCTRSEAQQSKHYSSVCKKEGGSCLVCDEMTPSPVLTCGLVCLVGVPHDDTVAHFAKLHKVILQFRYKTQKVSTLHERLTHQTFCISVNSLIRSPSLVSQLIPPTKSLLQVETEI